MPHCISMYNPIQKESDEQGQIPSEPVKSRPEPERWSIEPIATLHWTQQRVGTRRPTRLHECMRLILYIRPEIPLNTKTAIEREVGR